MVNKVFPTTKKITKGVVIIFLLIFKLIKKIINYIICINQTNISEYFQKDDDN